MIKYIGKILIIAFLGTFFSSSIVGQGTIHGRVIDGASGEPIDFVTVAVLKVGTASLVGGATTEGGGYFTIDINSEDIYVEVSYIGYSTETIDRINFEECIANVGDIILSSDAKLLEEVVVQAEKSTTEFKLDKRVFNVGSDLSSTGASALEVLNNVPSVNVNIEGQVSLRGASGVQILINGKPSVLADESSNALGTITADMIERIEVITNPSAKYEAEGTAGIINIVLKKNEKKGLNGSISVNTGIPDNHSVGLSINNRTANWNLFTQLGVGYRRMPSAVETTNIDKVNNSEIRSEGKEFRNETFYNLILGTDYYINPKNIITLSGSYAYEVEDQPSNITFEAFDQGEMISSWTRSEVTSATNPKLQYELQYASDLEGKDHELLFSAIGNYFGKTQSSIFTNDFFRGESSQPDQLTATSFNESKHTFNLDYKKPFDKRWMLEVGTQYLINDVNNDFEVQNESLKGIFEIDPNLTNIFEYSQDVLGAYTTGAYEGDIWGVKAGLRVENTDLRTRLVNTNEKNRQNFTNLFPSLHTSYKLSQRVSLQAGYSRRIYRPRLWDLNPFFNIRNNFNIRAGNPNLLPEFTDSYEVGAIFIFEQITFNTNVYHRYTTDKVERVSIFEDNVTLWTPQNIGTNKATGIEANFKYSPFDKITINGDANYNIFRREGQFNDQNFDFDADQWTGKMTMKYKVNKAIDAEVTGQYESREITIQGRQAGNLFADVGLRYKIMKGRGVFNLSVRDVFASRIRQTTIDNDTFYTFSRGQRGRFVAFGFSYGFGKGEAMQYSGGRRR